MGDLSKHFSRHEFKCKGKLCLCRALAVDKVLVDVLEEVRTVFNKPVTVSSGYRCKSHNKSVKGGVTSVHLLGKAADIIIVGVPARDIQLYLENRYPDTYGIGRYEGFTHIDVRSKKARW